MEHHVLPSVDTTYTNPEGERFIVIGRGTRGVVVEYRDGRVELIPLQQWRRQQFSPARLH